MTAGDIRKDRVFWLIVLTAVLGGGLHSGLLTHVVAAITDKGFSPTVAAQVLSISTLLGLSGSLGGGFAVDHFRRARVLCVFALLSALGMLLFSVVSASVGGLPLLIAAMAMQVAANAATRPIGTYLQTRFFGLRAFAEANAIQIVFQGLALSITPPLFGLIYEKAGSYAPVYWILVAGALVSAAIYLLLGPYRFSTHIGAAGVGEGAAETGRPDALGRRPRRSDIVGGAADAR